MKKNEMLPEQEGAGRRTVSNEDASELLKEVIKKIDKQEEKEAAAVGGQKGKGGEGQAGDDKNQKAHK